jgi:hypothetical protein
MKRRRPMIRVLIEQLNADAAAIARAEIPPAEAIREAARQANLIMVLNGKNVILYRSARGAFVSAWLEGPHGSYIGPGGAGFDDRINWPDIDIQP